MISKNKPPPGAVHVAFENGLFLHFPRTERLGA